MLLLILLTPVLLSLCFYHAVFYCILWADMLGYVDIIERKYHEMYGIINTTIDWTLLNRTYFYYISIVLVFYSKIALMLWSYINIFLKLNTSKNALLVNYWVNI